MQQLAEDLRKNTEMITKTTIYTLKKTHTFLHPQHVAKPCLA
jgi:hypothetical protein